jgi:uncharacterized membrane protein HdeD (DUF308 family)
MLATLAQDWALFILRGILALVIGALAFLAPGPTLGALIFVFAFFAILDGVLAIGVGLTWQGGPRWSLVIGGVLAVAIGVYTGFNPGVTATALVILIGAFVLVQGVAETVAGFSLRSVLPDAWLVILSGVVSIVFGAYVLVTPNNGALALVFVFGFYAIFAGIVYIAAGIRLRSVDKTIDQAVNATKSTTA